MESKTEQTKRTRLIKEDLKHRCGKICCFICKIPFELLNQDTHLPICQSCRNKIVKDEIKLPIKGKVRGLTWSYGYNRD